MINEVSNCCSAVDLSTAAVIITKYTEHHVKSCGCGARHLA